MFIKPGLATKEFNEGKRVKYLNPIQLYIFATTIFFLLAYSVSLNHTNSPNPKIKTPKNEILKDVADSLKNDTDIEIDLGFKKTEKGTQIGIGNWTPKENNLHDYDSVQNSLPDNLKDGYFKNIIIQKSFKAAELDDFGEVYIDSFKHNIPKVFFILLPFFALLLKLLFFRKKYYYVDHIIFSIHFHAFGFIIALISLLLALINFNLNDDFIFFIVAIILGVYLFISLKRVYPSPWWKILLKQFILFATYFIGFLFTMALLMGYTFLTM
jgi:hypothetical protein